MRSMKNIHIIIRRYVALLAMLLFSSLATAQQSIVVDLSAIDGMPITADNILGYHIHQVGGTTSQVQVKGTIHYRNSPITLSYSFKYTLRAGVNTISADLAHPQWQFSSNAVRELFFNYKMLPEGTYEYCVSVSALSVSGEATGPSFDECIFHKSEDIFLINLLEPEDKTKLHEYNPMLAWVANCPFASELTYRLRVAEIKQGQNPVNAVMRNQPVYDESNLTTNSMLYPLFARPLVKNQLYAWTVDAYYKGVLLGGAETWQFIIPEDTLSPGFPANRSYVDIKRESGKVQLAAIGQLKLKYVLDKMKKDVLTLKLMDGSSQISLKTSKLDAVYGDNRYVLNLKEEASLKHKHLYRLVIHSNTGEDYELPFQYFNPDFE